MPGYAIGGPDQGGTAKTWPDVVTRTVTAGEAITAGQAVGYYVTGLTSTTFNTDTVYVIGAATQYVCGVALHAAASGARLKIQTWGPNQVAMTNAATSTTLHCMVPAAAGAFTSTAQSHAASVPTIFGQVHVSSGSTAQAINTVFLTCHHGWSNAVAGPDRGGTGKVRDEICTRRVKAGEAITAGQVLTLYDDGTTPTAANFDAMRVFVTGAATHTVCGVALEDAAENAWFQMQTYGPNQVAMTCDGTTSETHCLVPAAAGVFTSTTSAHDNSSLVQFGHVVVATAATAVPVNTVFLTCAHDHGALAGPDQGGTGKTYQQVGILVVTAAEAITAGNLVTCYNASAATAALFDSLSVWKATNTTDFIRGVALDTATASGQQIRIQYYGPNQIALTCGTGDSTATHAVCAHATDGAFTSVAVDSTTVSAITMCGHVLVASSSSSNAVNTVFLNCMHA